MDNNLDKVLNFDVTNTEKDNSIENNVTEQDIDKNTEEKEEKAKRGRPKKTEQINTTETNINNKETANTTKENNTNETEEAEDNPILELATYLKQKNNWNDLEFNNINDLDEFADIINQYVSNKRKPDINDPLFNVMYEYVSLGGNALDFINSINDNNNKLNINLQDENSKLNFLYSYLKDTTNWDENKIKNYINKAYNNNLIEEELKEAINYYVEEKSNKIKNLLEEQKSRAKEIEDNYKKTYEMYMDIIYNKPDTVLGEKIDKKTKDSFTSFIFEKDDTGYSPYQKMLINSPESELKFAYELYKIYVNNSDENTKKSNLINKLKGQIKSNNKSNSSKQEVGNGDIKDTLNKIFNF